VGDISESDYTATAILIYCPKLISQPPPQQSLAVAALCMLATSRRPGQGGRGDGRGGGRGAGRRLAEKNVKPGPARRRQRALLLLLLSPRPQVKLFIITIPSVVVVVALFLLLSLAAVGCGKQFNPLYLYLFRLFCVVEWFFM
jgi:hypothetical protein